MDICGCLFVVWGGRVIGNEGEDAVEISFRRFL